MSVTSRSALIGLCAAMLVAWRLGGALGRGALAGYLVGASLTAFALARQRRVLRRAPGQALRTTVEGFLLKLGAVALLALLFALFAPLRERLDPRSSLLGFGAAVLLVLLPGTFENARILEERRAE